MTDRSDGASGSCFWISVPYRPDRSVSQQSLYNSRLVRRIVSPRMRSTLLDDLEPPIDDSMKSGFISHGGECASEHEPIANSHCGLRILLVDDSALIRKATSRSLINEGYSVEVARQGAECLKMLEASRATCTSGGYGFDVVLMDLQMPVMDGLEATRRIRALEQAEEESCHGSNVSSGGGNGGGGGSVVSRHIKIIGVSAHTEGEARAECADCGMDSFIEKPLQMKHLRRCLLSMNVVAEVKVNNSSDDFYDLDRQTIMEILPIR